MEGMKNKCYPTDLTLAQITWRAGLLGTGGSPTEPWMEAQGPAQRLLSVFRPESATKSLKRVETTGTSLVVQGLRLCTPNAGGLEFNPWSGN